MRVRVGCCGLAGLKLKTYASRFPLIEVQSTFYKLPRVPTAERWRRVAPHLIFTVKAFQGVTHPADSPTWRKARRELEGVDPSEVGLLKQTAFTKRSWERTNEISEALDARVIVVQLPPVYEYSEKNLGTLKRFFSSVPVSSIPAIEFRHKSWMERLEEARKEVARWDGVIITDPLKVKTPAQAIHYHRMHGGNGFVHYKHRYTEDELRELARKVAEVDTYVLFNNVSMKEDAERFLRMV